MPNLQRVNAFHQHVELKINEGFLIFNDYNISYLSLFSGHAATVIMTQSVNFLICDYRYVQQAYDDVKGFEVFCRDRENQSLAEVINNILISHGINTIYFESDHISYASWQSLQAQLVVKNCQPTSRVIERLRYQKDEAEMQYIKNAANIADQALLKMMASIKPGVSEKELAIELEYHMSTLGSEALSFPTILLFGERTALPHGSPSHRELEIGDLILIDFGATVGGYHSDMTRTYVCGKASKKQKQIHHIVKSAQQAVFDAIDEGITGKSLNLIAHQVLDESDYGRFKGEGLGHGLGLELHESPIMNSHCDLTLNNGCVVTIEPGIYIPSWGGIRLEDDVAITEQGLSILTSASNELLEL